MCLQSVGDEISAADIERSGGLGLDFYIEGGAFSVKVINRLQGDFVMIHEALTGRTRSSNTASRVQVLFLIE